jgi:DNA-binding MarR family transcriptional regulator
LHLKIFHVLICYVSKNFKYKTTQQVNIGNNSNDRDVTQNLGGLSKNQKRILDMLEIKPDMTTKEIAEMIFGKIIKYKSKEYASVHRSIISLEKQGCIKRVQIQLRWQRTNKSIEEKAKTNEIFNIEKN